MIAHATNLRSVATPLDFGVLLIGTDLAETLTGGGREDILIGLDGGDQLDGNGRSDSLFGGAGDDVLSGGTGDDLLSGGAGFDQIFGGLGIDTVNFADEPGGVRADLGAAGPGAPAADDLITGVENAVGGAGDDTITGSDLANTLDGAAGADRLMGAAGRDRIFGGSDNDSLYGGADNDTMLGGDGRDQLFGGQGADVMRGGGGADRFVFAITSDLGANDRIVDFQSGIDKFVLSETPGGAGNPAVTFSALLNGNTLVTVGDSASPLFEIEVQTLRGPMTLGDVLFI